MNVSDKIDRMMPSTATGAGTKVAEKLTGTKGPDFSERLKGAVEAVNSEQKIADAASEAVIRGDMDIHDGMLRVQEADLSLRMLLQVRRRVLDAYQEIMRMPF